MERLEVYFDGSCGPYAHGVAAYGFVVYDDQHEILHKGYGRVGSGPEISSNVAEFEGLYQSMLYILQHHPNAEVAFFGDSSMVIDQMNGEAKARKGKYVPYAQKTMALARGRTLWSYRWIARAFNSEADELAQYQRD